MRSKPKILLFVAVAVAAMNVTAQTNSWQLSDPGAKMLMGIDIKSLRESEVGQSIREQIENIAPMTVESPLQRPMQAIAAGLLDQVDRVYASSKPNPPAIGVAAAKHNPPFVLIVEGRFPAAELQPFLKGKVARRYRDADLYRMSQTDATTFAFIKGPADSSTLLLGDEKSVIAAIGRRSGVLVPASALLKRAQTLAATNDFWLIADGPLSGFQPTSPAAGNPMASKLAAQVKGLDIGLALHDGFHLDLGVAAESEAVAAQLTQLLSMQIQSALAAQPNQPGMAELAHKLQIASEGNRMQLSMALTKDEFAQQMRPTAKAPSQPAPLVVRQTKPANPGQITIYGLDGGPRVIQTSH